MSQIRPSAAPLCPSPQYYVLVVLLPLLLLLRRGHELQQEQEQAAANAAKTRVVVLTKSAIVTVVQFLSTGFPRKKNIFLPLLLSASTVGFHQPSQCLKNISK